MPETENTPESSPEETTVTQTEPTEVEGESSSDDGKPGASPIVPKGRFNEVLAERNAAREENQTLKARLDALEAKLAPKPESTKPKLAEPPEGLSQRETVDWYVQDGARRLIESELGMDLKSARALLASTQSVAADSASARWAAACKKHGLDDQDRMVQATVLGLVQGQGIELEAALGETAKRFANGKGRTVATVPENTRSGVMTQTDQRPKNKEEAAEMARAGKRVKFRSSLDILADKRAGNRR